MNESANIASLAIRYYKKPIPFGGGGRSFIGWSIPSSVQSTTNGNYYADIYQDSVVITAMGSEVVTGTDSIEVKTTVSPTSYRTEIVR